MLLMPQKKKLATVIVGKMTTPDFVQKMGEESSTGGYNVPEEDDSMVLEEIMGSFMRAIDRRDAKQAVQALKDFMELCGSEESGEPQADPYDASARYKE